MSFDQSKLKQKNYPWDLWEVVSDPHFKLPRCLILRTFDPFVEKIFLEKILCNNENTIVRKWAEDVSCEWIIQNCLTPDLFASAETYIIYNSQNLTSSVSEMLAEKNNHLEKKIILSFIKEDSLTAPFKKLKESTDIVKLEVASPAFWHGPEILDFLTKIHEMDLSPDAQDFFESSLSVDFSLYFSELQRLKLLYGKSISLNQVMEGITASKVDHFRFANLLSQKNYKQFFIELQSFSHDHEIIFSIFSFLQGHFLKIMDPSYLKNKSKVNKYDKDILAGHKIWAINDLKKVFIFLNEIVRHCREESDFLYTYLNQQNLTQD